MKPIEEEFFPSVPLLGKPTSKPHPVSPPTWPDFIEKGRAKLQFFSPNTEEWKTASLQTWFGYVRGIKKTRVDQIRDDVLKKFGLRALYLCTVVGLSTSFCFLLEEHQNGQWFLQTYHRQKNKAFYVGPPNASQRVLWKKAMSLLERSAFVPPAQSKDLFLEVALHYEALRIAPFSWSLSSSS